MESLTPDRVLGLVGAIVIGEELRMEVHLPGPLEGGGKTPGFPPVNQNPIAIGRRRLRNPLKNTKVIRSLQKNQPREKNEDSQDHSPLKKFQGNPPTPKAFTTELPPPCMSSDAKQAG